MIIKIEMVHRSSFNFFSAENDGEKFISATARFKRLFGMPDEEKLVNCKFFLSLYREKHVCFIYITRYFLPNLRRIALLLKFKLHFIE